MSNDEVTRAMELVSPLADEIQDLEDRADELERWLEQNKPKPEDFKQFGPQESAEHDDYKELDLAASRAKKAFSDYRHRTTSKRTTIEEYCRQIELAVLWGEAVLEAARERISFMEQHRYAYASAEKTLSDIDHAREMLNGTTNSITEAKKVHKSMGVLR